MRYQLTFMLLYIMCTKVNSADSDGLKKIYIQKCCPHGQGRVQMVRECMNMSSPFDLQLTAWNGSKDLVVSNVDFLVGWPKCTRAYASVYPTFPIYNLTEKGELLIMTSKGAQILPPEEYCLDMYLKKDRTTMIINAFFCNDTEPSKINYGLNAYCMLVSCFFILLTVSVYLVLPKLRNLPGMVLIACLLCFFVIFFNLALIILSKTQFSRTTCHAFKFIIYFFMLAAFSWMNVMSYDIWNTFRGNAVRITSPSSRFCWYCAYAFGVPTALTVMLAVCQYTDIPVPIKPRFDVQKCFFDGQVKQYYLYIPVSLLCIGNIIMFLLTAVTLAYSQSERRLNSEDSAVHNKRKDRLWVYIKLFTLMGISWIFEVISSLYPEARALWQVIDVYNLLVGFVIFIMFVCKRNIYNKLLERLGLKKRFTSFTTRTTRTTSLQTQSSQTASKEDSAKTKDVEMPFLNGDQNLKGPDNYM